MRCLGLQLIFLLSLTQCTRVYSLPQGISRPDPPSPDSLASELLSAASAFQSSTAANGNGGGSSNGQATATGSSKGSGTGTATATRTSNASSGQTGATGTATATGTAAADNTGNAVGGTGTQASTGGNASATGSASNSQGTAGTGSGTSATDNSQGATSTINSASPGSTSGGSSSGDPDSTSGGGSNGDGSGGGNDGDGSGGGSGSGSGSDTQNKGSSNSGLSRGELAAVVVLPILVAFAIFFLLFRYYRQIRDRFNAWRQDRNERGAYRRALDDPVGVFGIKHRRRSTGLSLPDMQSIMRPLSFGFAHPQRETIKRKPLNYDASRINAGGFSSIGMAMPNSTTDRVDRGGDDGGGHQRTESEISAITHATANANGAAVVGGGRTRNHSSTSSFSSVSSTGSQDEESTGFVDARTSQRASQIIS